MGDEKVREPELALQRFQQVQDLRLHRDGPSALVGSSQTMSFGRDGPGRARWRCAGADRPRTRGDSDRPSRARRPTWSRISATRFARAAASAPRPATAMPSERMSATRMRWVRGARWGSSAIGVRPSPPSRKPMPRRTRSSLRLDQSARVDLHGVFARAAAPAGAPRSCRLAATPRCGWATSSPGHGVAGRGGGCGGAREARRRISSTRWGLPRDFVDRYPHEFSGGQRTAHRIAPRPWPSGRSSSSATSPRARSTSPVQAQILNLRNRPAARARLSYLSITHNIAVVEYLAHEVAVMYLGPASSSAARRRSGVRSPKHPVTQALLARVPKDRPGRGRARSFASRASCLRR